MEKVVSDYFKKFSMKISKPKSSIRINIGCGLTPTSGWLNFDNSFSLKLSRIPYAGSLLYRTGLITLSQKKYIVFCKKNKIKWADATKKIPVKDGSVEILYSAHMLEHLDRDEAVLFLKEANRVLIKGGIIRLVLPDFEHLVKRYIANKDANQFLEDSLLCIDNSRKFSKRIHSLIFGNRNHLWMYNSQSLEALIANNGFIGEKILLPGETMIPNPGNLDLFERKSESIYIEAYKV